MAGPIFSAAKGDILLELPALLIEGVLRIFTRTSFQYLEHQSISTWGWPHWLIVMTILGLCIWLVARAINRRRLKNHR